MLKTKENLETKENMLETEGLQIVRITRNLLSSFLNKKTKINNDVKTTFGLEILNQLKTINIIYDNNTYYLYIDGFKIDIDDCLYITDTEILSCNINNGNILDVRIATKKGHPPIMYSFNTLLEMEMLKN